MTDLISKKNITEDDIECEEFYNICQAYRHAKDNCDAVNAYSALKKYIAELLINSAPVVKSIEHDAPSAPIEVQEINGTSIEKSTGDIKIIGYVSESDLTFPFAYPSLSYQSETRNIPVYVDNIIPSTQAKESEG